MTELGPLAESLWRVVTSLGDVLAQLFFLLLNGSLLVAWVAWWLFGVDWRKLWPVLARGAWAPLVLLMVVSALAWSRIAPSSCDCLGFVRVGNFWWQLGAIGLLGAVTLFCGYVQDRLGWTPPEISLEPPAHTDHGHRH